MDADTKQKKDELTAFLKKAFCIDGDCVLKTETSKVVTSTGEVLNDALTFELTDSKRGKFQVTISK